MNGRKIYPYARSHTTATYNYTPQSASPLSTNYALTGVSQAAPYSRPSFPYRRTWTGFSSVVAIHPSQLRRRRERRYHLEDIPEYVKPVEVPRIKRISSTMWETPKGGDKNFADVVNTPYRFKARIDLGMFEYFDHEEIDVNLYGYDIQIYACKDNIRDPNRPLRVLNRQYRLPDDVDLKTVKLDRHKTKSEIPQDYGKPITFHITDVTQAGKRAELLRGF
ncbi:hypothetical protein M3Y97_00128500 [Aphelenchoides bicaudatus]|nr:hypothetical protein M3Y97_00128500 [Aphelenchoides bicaudatus]